MPIRRITGRQVKAMVIGPNGPIEVGRWEEATVTLETETDEAKLMDGSVEVVVTGKKYSGTLKRGHYDAALAEETNRVMNPGSDDPPRLMLLMTLKYNDGTVKQALFKEVLFTKWGFNASRGMVTEDVDWVAEDMEWVS